MSEFLVATLAIFTAWSEIGGQPALDIMPWGWKVGLWLALASSITGFTAALEGSETFWTLRSARWAAVILASALLMGVVTYYYSLQVETGDSEEGGTISRIVVVSSPKCSIV